MMKAIDGVVRALQWETSEQKALIPIDTLSQLQTWACEIMVFSTVSNRRKRGCLNDHKLNRWEMIGFGGFSGESVKTREPFQPSATVFTTDITSAKCVGATDRLIIFQ